MVDKPPPSRFSVVERGGRLVVIDRVSGTTPPSAAERMAEHDRRMGHRTEPPAAQPRAATPPARASSPAPTSAPAANRPAVSAPAAKTGQGPWREPGGKRDSRATSAKPAARPQARAGSGERKTIVTGKWWDAKGPRTIELGPRGQQVLTGGFMSLFFMALIAAVAMLFLIPVVFVIAAFLLFRFGGPAVSQIGAGLVDKALAEKG